MQVTERAPGDRQFIESYGPGRFTVSGVVHRGSILVFSDRTEAWPVAVFADLTAEDLRAAMADTGVDFILLGCGPKAQFPARAVRDAARAAGVALEPMDTGAACRTFNVLILEERRVAAALIAL
jgi:uncharacterized protein